MKDFVGRTALPELTMQRVILNLFFVICLPDFVTKVDFDWAIDESETISAMIEYAEKQD